MKTVLTHLLLFLSPIFLRAAEVSFSSAPFTELEKQAFAEHKFILIDISTGWCGPCKAIASQTFSDNAVAGLLNSHFVTARYDAEKDYGLAMAMKYRVRAYPSLLVFNDKGEYIDRMVGYYSAPEFLDMLNHLLNTPPSAAEGISDALNPGFPEFYKQIFYGEKTADEIDPKLVDDFLNTHSLLSEAGWSVLTQVYKGTKYAGWLGDNFNEVSKLYSEREAIVYRSQLYFKLIDGLSTADDNTKFNQILRQLSTYTDDAVRDLIFDLKIAFYQKSKQFNYLVQAVETYYNAGQLSPDFYNSISYLFYEENCTDKTALIKAVNWMQSAYEKKKTASIAETYAAVLYQAGQYPLAEKIIKESVEMQKSARESTKEQEVLLAKITSAQGRK